MRSEALGNLWESFRSRHLQTTEVRQKNTGAARRSRGRTSASLSLTHPCTHTLSLSLSRSPIRRLTAPVHVVRLVNRRLSVQSPFDVKTWLDATMCELKYCVARIILHHTLSLKHTHTQIHTHTHILSHSISLLFSSPLFNIVVAACL